MTDKTLTETDDNDDLIVVETPPEEQTQDAAVEDDEDEEDERLSTSDDDHEDDVTGQSDHNRRAKRRERQKKARDAAQRELQMLRETVARLSQQVDASRSQSEMANVNIAGQTVEQQLARAVMEVQQAERVIAAAASAGNGDDVVAAMRIRDEAMAEVNKLNGVKQQVEQARQQVSQPRIDPAVVNYAKEWMSANPWYDPQGRDRDSALTKAIDNELVREGYDPKSRVYWEELTARVGEALEGGSAPQRTAADEGRTAAQSPRRKAPPTGNTREHAPVSTKREIYVTPERKAAMIEAGVWDDPVQRQRYLKAYQAYDNGSAR